MDGLAAPSFLRLYQELQFGLFVDSEAYFISSMIVVQGNRYTVIWVKFTAPVHFSSRSWNTCSHSWHLLFEFSNLPDSWTQHPSSCSMVFNSMDFTQQLGHTHSRTLFLLLLNLHSFWVISSNDLNNMLHLLTWVGHFQCPILFAFHTVCVQDNTEVFCPLLQWDRLVRTSPPWPTHLGGSIWHGSLNKSLS